MIQCSFCVYVISVTYGNATVQEDAITKNKMLCQKYAQKRLLCLSEFVIHVLHYYTRILFYHLKQAQKSISNLSNVKKGKCPPLIKTNGEYYINITFPDWVIVENIILRNVIITFPEMIFSTITQSGNVIFILL